MAQRQQRKVTSSSGKSHQGRTNSMAQHVSSVMIHIAKSGRSTALCAQKRIDIFAKNPNRMDPNRMD